MSLLRLLSAGKSLVGSNDANTRYEMGDPRAMPKFISAKNPFRSKEKSKAPTEQKAATPKFPTANCPEPAAAQKQSSTDGAGKLRVGQKLKSFVGLFSVRRTKPAIPEFTRPAVQGELSLDAVRVVRNDLSDADLEIVPARRERQPMQAEPADPIGAVNERIEPRPVKAPESLVEVGQG